MKTKEQILEDWRNAIKSGNFKLANTYAQELKDLTDNTEIDKSGNFKLKDIDYDSTTN